MPAESILIVVLSCILFVAAIQDILYQKIPNALTLPTMLGGCVYHCLLSGLSGFLFSASGLFLGIALLILPFLLGGMGAGDAKLMGAVGAVLGAKGVFIAFLLTCLCGGIYAFILLIVHHQYLRDFFKGFKAFLKTLYLSRALIFPQPNQDEQKPRLCYGVAIAFGTWLALFLDVMGNNNIISFL